MTSTLRFHRQDYKDLGQSIRQQNLQWRPVNTDLHVADSSNYLYFKANIPPPCSVSAVAAAHSTTFLPEDIKKQVSLGKNAKSLSSASSPKASSSNNIMTLLGDPQGFKGAIVPRNPATDETNASSLLASNRYFVSAWLAYAQDGWLIGSKSKFDVNHHPQVDAETPSDIVDSNFGYFIHNDNLYLRIDYNKILFLPLNFDLTGTGPPNSFSQDFTITVYVAKADFFLEHNTCYRLRFYVARTMLYEEWKRERAKAVTMIPPRLPPQINLLQDHTPKRAKVVVNTPSSLSLQPATATHQHNVMAKPIQDNTPKNSSEQVYKSLSLTKDLNPERTLCMNQTWTTPFLQLGSTGTIPSRAKNQTASVNKKENSFYKADSEFLLNMDDNYLKTLLEARSSNVDLLNLRREMRVLIQENNSPLSSDDEEDSDSSNSS